MPRNQALRRWLWRANGVLAVLLCAVVSQRLLMPEVERPLPVFECDWSDHVWREPPRTVDLAELERECGRYWSTALPQEPKPRLPETPTRPPLGAYEVRVLVQIPDGPDGIALACKDPAHPDWYFPSEVEPDHGVSLEEVRVEGLIAKVTVASGDEIHTFAVPLRPRPDPRIVRVTGSGTERGERTLPEGTNSPPTRLPGGLDLAAHDVKCVPFYGPDGQVSGLRVTGIRPGGRFARMGLERGDVVLQCGGESMRSPVSLARLGADRAAPHLTVRRECEGSVRTLELRGS